MKKHSTKRALLFSALAMLLCLSMLVGSTFAWFTDSVVSAGNKIQAGTLEVQLLMYNGTEYADISETSAPIFGAGSIAQDNNAQTLWEPGKTQVAYLAIKNNGSLALKYQVGLNVVNVSNDLYEVMEYAITPDAQQGSVTAWDDAAAQTVVEGTQVVTTDVALEVGATHYFALSIHMMEEAGNEYQAGEVDFDLVVLATQNTVEFDSFDNLYDEEATYPLYAAGGTAVTGADEYEIPLKRIDGSKVGSAIVAKENLAADANAVKINIYETARYAGLTVAEDKVARTYEVRATGLVEGTFPDPIMVELNIGTGLTGVEVYHYADQLTPATYNPSTGRVKFEATSFSPYTFVYDKVPVEQPEPDGSDTPEAKLVAVPELANTKIQWNNWGGFWPPLGEEQTLDAIYKFAAPDNTNIQEDPYKNWICDFYVMLEDEGNASQEIPVDALTLGGHYGDYGWVGFGNPEGVYTNEFIPLLQSVAGGWTYESIYSFVGEFMCGVASNSDWADGMTFVVELRLVNPNAENTAYPAEGEYVVTNRVEYTFN